VREEVREGRGEGVAASAAAAAADPGSGGGGDQALGLYWGPAAAWEDLQAEASTPRGPPYMLR
jgi:hypothetical protein